jgi:hypothetical protein
MDINLGNSDAGADGMAFVIQNDPLGRCKCGTVGGALGAGGILNSVTVEIDTYINTEDRDDFTGPFIGCAGTEDPDHLDIWFNGVINPDLDFSCDATAAGERPATPNAVRLQSAPGVNYNIENGLTHKLRISWNAGTSTLTASILNSGLTVTYGTISTTFNPITVFGTNAPYFGFTGSTGGLSNQQIFCLPAILLPVDMVSFDVSCIDRAADIRWSTETERENSFFTIERSCNGIDFTPVATMKGSGTTQEQHSYAISDDAPCQGISYYRLSQTDNNGTSEVLGIRSVQSCGGKEELFVFPNPASEELSVSWSGMNVERLVLTNTVGQVIREYVAPELHAKQVTFDVSGYASGIYYVNVWKETGMETLKVTIE